MKVAIIGTHGIPAQYGGFETFAEEISKYITSNSTHSVTVICNNGSSIGGDDSLKNISILNSRFSKKKNPILYYLESMILTMWTHDLVICCGPAGGLFAVFKYFSRAKIAINIDGLNHKRSKWSFRNKFLFRFFNMLSIRLADYVICDAAGIQTYAKLISRHAPTYVLKYGAHPNNEDIILSRPLEIETPLGKKELQPESFFLIVARIVPENNILEIIRAFVRSGSTKNLVIVGALGDDVYSQLLRSAANDNVVFAGGIYETDLLLKLRRASWAYLHGHSVGGTNPSLVEAMASGNLIIAHDNEFNRETCKNSALYFKDEQHLMELLKRDTTKDVRHKYQMSVYSEYEEAFTWEKIGLDYLDFIEFAVGNKKRE